jgi:hypothetical protein
MTVNVTDTMIEDFGIETDVGEEVDEDTLHDAIMEDFVGDPIEFIHRCGDSVEPVTVDIIA